MGCGGERRARDCWRLIQISETPTVCVMRSMSSSRSPSTTGRPKAPSTSMGCRGSTSCSVEYLSQGALKDFLRISSGWPVHHWHLLDRVALPSRAFPVRISESSNDEQCLTHVRGLHWSRWGLVVRGPAFTHSGAPISYWQEALPPL